MFFFFSQGYVRSDIIRLNSTVVALINIDRPSTVVDYVHPHPEWHITGVATVEVDPQCQVVEPLWNEGDYYNAAAFCFKIKYYLG